MLRGRGIEAGIKRHGELRCDRESELVVLSLPYKHARPMVVDMKDSFGDQIVVSPVVPMSRVGKRFDYTPPAEGSAALMFRDLLPPSVKVVAAFHTISASSLQNLDRTLEGDVLIAGDDSSSNRS